MALRTICLALVQDLPDARRALDVRILRARSVTTICGAALGAVQRDLAVPGASTRPRGVQRPDAHWH